MYSTHRNKNCECEICKRENLADVILLAVMLTIGLGLIIYAVGLMLA